ncbi:hypothetical protein TNCV_2983521 [Trichonephila clavipes]|nr:hypothetical protein TNCV_2983521 [Trichonephila clavipes]
MPEEALVNHIFVRLEPQFQDYVRGNYESGRQRNQWFESRNGLNRDDQRFDRGYQSENRVQSENFSRGDRRNRGSSTNFS